LAECDKDHRVAELSAYQGFEGELKDIYYLRNGDPDLKLVYELFLEAPKIKEHKVLYVGSFASGQQVSALKVGYDVGICMEECIFSSIFHEILYGRVPDLLVFKDLLNDNILFCDKETAQKYV
jgi:hypothetical protein